MSVIDYDLEFLENGRVIDLISIGMVADNGREYYAVNSDAPWKTIRKNTWLVRNVLPSLPLTGRASLDSYLKMPEHVHPKTPLDMVGPDMRNTHVKPHFVIANEVRDFIQDTADAELWADYSAYDHVCLAQLWGSMDKLPSGIPMHTNDIQQEARRLGIPWDALPQQNLGEHNALEDARHVRTRRLWLAEQSRTAVS